MKRSIFLFLMILGTTLFSQTAIAPSLGDGSEENPYLISTLENLNWIAASNSNWNKHYLQISDIDASSTNVTEWKPIGNNPFKFRGAYDGQNFAIENLVIDGEGYEFVGLFGYAEGATFSNIIMSSVQITGVSYIGGLIGYSNLSYINNCSVIGSINGRYYLGGLIGYSNSSTIENCTGNTNVTGIGSLGGLIGVASNNSTIVRSFSTGTIDGTTYVGGFIGNSNTSVINDCYSVVNPDGDDAVGGFIGYNVNSDVSNSYSSGSVTGETNTGGLIGSNNYSAINNCFWDIQTSGQSISAGGTGKTTIEMTGKITFTDAGWDFIDESINGDNDYWNIERYSNQGYPFLEQKLTYSSEYIITTSIADVQTDKVTVNGEVINLGESNIIQHGVCWNTTSLPTILDNRTEEGLRDSIGVFTTEITGLNRDQVYYCRSYFTNWEGTIYGNIICFKTPVINSTQPNGLGTVDDPYQIESLDNLYWILKDRTRWANNYIQTENINAAGTNKWYYGDHDDNPSTPVEYMGWLPIGNEPYYFTGTYNGQGNIIDSLYINRSSTDRIGLFGRVHYGCVLDSINLTNVNITGDNYVGGLVGLKVGVANNCLVNGMINGVSAIGGLVGKNYGLLYNCSSSSNVYGNSLVGGLVGRNVDNTIINCSSNGIIYGSNSVGGLIGSDWASNIINSYSTSLVNGSSYHTGGLIGWIMYSNITNCYATGNIIGFDRVGGLIGTLYNYGPIIANCYSSGKVEGNVNIGGFLGYIDDSETYKIEDCFWDIETSGQATSAGGIGKTTVEMKSMSTYANAGWDFAGESVNGTEDIWKLNEENNDGYPYLSWQYFPLGIPQNVRLSQNGDFINVFWNSVPEATSYIIYSSEDPYAIFPSGWTLETNVIGTIWTDRKTRKNKKFYIVVAEQSLKK